MSPKRPVLFLSGMQNINQLLLTFSVDAVADNLTNNFVAEQWLERAQKAADEQEQEAVLSSENCYQRVGLLPEFQSVYNICHCNVFWLHLSSYFSVRISFM